MTADLLTAAKNLQKQLTFWRREIHMHPELGFQEYRTAELIADTLCELGLAVETGIGLTGVVGRLGEGSPAIGLRADMDALPIQEENDVPYASQVDGVMHACGHDAHVAMLLGVAKVLAGLDGRPKGEVRFLFQPCEEVQDSGGKSGAPRMIEDGALDGLGAILALHIDSGATAGTIGVRSGYVMAAVDSFNAIVIGSGCHSAFPHEGISPIAILARVINAVQGIRTLRIDPLKPAIVTIESVHGGEAPGVIPNEVHISGNIRSFDEDVRSQLHRELERALSLTRSCGGDYHLNIESYGPATYNDPAIAGVMASAARDIVGQDAVFEPEPRMYGEDFSAMARRVPGAMAFLGVQADDELRPIHSPIFDLDESALPVGVALLSESVARLLLANLAFR